MSNFFVTIEIYKDGKLIHTHNDIPVNKITDIIVNWQGNASKGVIIDSDGNQYQEFNYL